MIFLFLMQEVNKLGQYYKFINMDKKEVCDRNRGGYKLMEHSYLNNDYCDNILTLLSNKWKGDRIIHMGDYADENDGTLTSHLIAKLKREFKPDTSFYNYSYNFEDIEPKKVSNKIRYVYNLDKMEYIDLYHQPIIGTWYYDGKASFSKINSFALLTACGNGQGGGDYCGVSKNNVGAWAGDHFVSSEKLLEEYKHFKENKISFFEDGINYTNNDEEVATYEDYDKENIKIGVDCINELIERLKKYDSNFKKIKLDIKCLTEEEKEELYSRNLEEIKYIKNKNDDLVL